MIALFDPQYLATETCLDTTESVQVLNRTRSFLIPLFWASLLVACSIVSPMAGGLEGYA